jgi:hypothetical protein
MKDKKLTSLLSDIQDQAAKESGAPEFKKNSINLLEEFAGKVESLEDENQKLKNELNKLKGETVPPNVRKQTSKDKSKHSSTSERKNKNKKKSKKGGSKKNFVKVDKTKKLTIDKEQLPDDAKCSGIKKTIIQDVIITTENIEFHRQMYFSKAENKTYIAPLPAGYEGEYGPNLKTWVKTFYSAAQVTIDNIAFILNTAGSLISPATISRIITNNNNELHDEKLEIVKAGLKSTPYQHLDDTLGRESGTNCYVNVLTNPYYTAYFTLSSKSRMSVIEMLSLDDVSYIFDNLSFSLMATMGLPEKKIELLKSNTSTLRYLKNGVDELLENLFPNLKKTSIYKKIILEAASISSYQRSEYAIKYLIVDDAPQFKLITECLGLCWVHEGRHYKKLTPFFKINKTILKQFIKNFWRFYELLKDYKKMPTQVKKIDLNSKFDELFSQKTGYQALDRQIARTLEKKEQLLLVLVHPSLPIHNNSAELAARFQARNRDVHYHTMSSAGTKIKDTLATIIMTAKKLSVNVFKYLFDKITKAYEMTPLAELIKLKADADLNLAKPTSL